LKHPPSRPLWWRAPRALLRGLLALVILFEEWGWEALSHALGRLAALPPVRWLEARIAALPPYAALAVFLVPSLLLVPVKLAALWFITRGHAGLGLAVIVLAKVAGTAVLARLFSLTRASLLRLAWFARLHDRWVAFKDELLAAVRASAVWQAARRLRRALGRGLGRRLRRLLQRGRSTLPR
jgi:hypothetical protein